MSRNRELLQKITTADLVAGGALLPEQAAEFFKMTFDATPFSRLHRKVQRKAKTGEIDKIAIGSRIIRKKTENNDDNYRAGVTHGKVEYATKAIRLPWEISEETFLENIEQDGYEGTVMGMMTTQLGIDLEDLHWNGDESDVADDFVSINEGWLQQLIAGGNKVDCTAEAKFNKSIMFKMTRALPNKYKSDKIKWMMSPGRKEYWQEYLTARSTGAGDAALLGTGDIVNRPLGYEIVTIPSFDDGTIVLGDPQNFISVWTYNIRIRKTTEGREAVMQDKRFYVVHLDDDPIIQDLSAAVIGYNITTTIGD